MGQPPEQPARASTPRPAAVQPSSIAAVPQRERHRPRPVAGQAAGVLPAERVEVGPLLVAQRHQQVVVHVKVETPQMQRRRDLEGPCGALPGQHDQADGKRAANAV